MIQKKYSSYTIFELASDIVKQYRKYHVWIDISKCERQNRRFIFHVQLKKNTRETHLRAHANEVQLKLSLPIFYVDRQNLDIFIIASQTEIEYRRLSVILKNLEFQNFANRAALPYVVGYDVFGDVSFDNLSVYPHLLLGGSTNSGKSVGLQTLISTIAYAKSPYQVNFILIDAGATDLLVFEKLPHLSCPIIRNRTTAAYVLAALTAELERRIELKHINQHDFMTLPILVVVIDEFSALFLNAEKVEKQTIIDNVSNLLQRGRHGKIHLVLAAQNPTSRNMHVDLGNITARIAFKCAKKNFSEIILGEPGAEKLAGNGDMLLKLPNHDLQRMQGIYATKEDLVELVEQIASNELIRRFKQATQKKRLCKPRQFVIEIPNVISTGTTASLGENLSCAVIGKRVSETDRLLASVIIWALGYATISANMLISAYHLGWNKASDIVKHLEKLGLVDSPNGKQPRNVCPSNIDDLSAELLQFLDYCGYPKESIISAFEERRPNQVNNKGAIDNE